MKTDIDFTGISNAPSDYNSADGVMSHLVNLIPEDGELKAMGKGTVMWTVPDGYILVYVHQTRSDGKHYIFRETVTKDDGTTYSTLYFQKAPETAGGDSDLIEIGIVRGVPKLISMGNTLIAYSQDEMHYFLWKSNGFAYSGVETWCYADLGTHLPELSVRFSMSASTTDSSWSKTDLDEVWFGSDPIMFKAAPADTANWKTSENQLYLEQQICAMVNKAIQTVSYYGNFIFPFFVRYAYRLFDGSTLTMHSAPILMLPSTTDAIQIVGNGFLNEEGGDELDAYKIRGLKSRARWLSGKLRCKITDSTQLQMWKDIIKSVDIFVSAPIYTYRQEGKEDVTDDPYMLSVASIGSFGFLEYGLASDYFDSEYITTSIPDYQSTRVTGTTSWIGQPTKGKTFLRCPRNSDEDIEKDARQKSLFYLLKSIPIEDISSYSSFKGIPIDKGYLNSLVTKEVMTDDYITHDSLLPATTYIYNSRLNIANVRHSLFNGFAPYLMTRDIEYVDSDITKVFGEVDYYTEIKSDSGANIKCASGSVYDMGFYFYYPNSSASRLEVCSKKNNKTCVFALKPHDFLNGAYFLAPFWEGIKSVSEYYTWTDATKVPTAVDNPLDESNKVYTSAANMPFHFPVTGINTVGTGNIIGLTSITKALSEGQFGQFPMYAFTDEGIWALSLSETGSIATVTPVTRDVCNNEKTITQIDDAILFSSNRGLMMLTGSETRCLSEQLDGDWFDATTLKGWSELNRIYPNFSNYNLKFGSFKEFIKNSVIAYDYPRQRILVMNTDNNIVMVYSIRSGQWGQAKIGYAITVVNSYPSSVVQERQYLSVGTAEILDISTENTERVLTLGVTRPFSFGDKDALKTINDVIMRGENTAVILYGTRNNTDWYLVGSSKNRYLRGMCGSPYKTFRIVFISNLASGQIVKGASFEITPKDNNVLR